MESAPRRNIPRIIPLLLLAALLFAGFLWHDTCRCVKSTQAKPDVRARDVIVSPDGWRMTAQSSDSGGLFDTEVCSSNGFVDVVFSGAADERATLYCVMPVEVKMSKDFLLHIPVMLSSWQSVSLLAVGVRNGTNGYYYVRKSHPSQDVWHSVELSPLNRLRFIVDNTLMPPLTNDTFSIDHVRAIVLGVPGLDASVTIGEGVLVPQSERSPKPILPALKDILRENINYSAQAVAEHFCEKPTPSGERVKYTEDDIKRGELLVAKDLFQTVVHPPVQVHGDPSWIEDPFNDTNWRYRWHGFDWLRAITAEFRNSGSARSAKKAVFLIKDWAADMLGTMPCDHIVWYDMSVPDRMKRMVEFFEVYRTSSIREPDVIALLLRLIHAHAELCADDDFYARHQPVKIHNHPFVQDEALLRTALTFPEFRESPEWERKAMSRIDMQLSHGLTDEGVLKENTSIYHFSMIDHVRRANSILEYYDREPAFAETEKKMVDFAAALLRPSGDTADFGDTAMPVKLPENDSDMTFLLSQGKEGSRPSWLDRLFVKSGYVTFRDRWWSADEFNMGVHTLFLAGYNSITHKHRDDLSFTIYGYGEEWLVDAGMYKYDHRDKFQLYARSARAHNTVSIDGADFPISRALVGATGITDCYSGPDAAFVEASTRAYGDVTFSRKLLFIRPNVWIVEDQLEDVKGKGHDFVQHFHFAPDKQPEPMGNCLLVKGRTNARMTLVDPCGHPPPVLRRGVTEPRIQGWFFPQYGQKTENVCADYRLRGESVCFVKVLVLEGKDPHARKIGDIDLRALEEGIPKLAPGRMAAALLRGTDMGDRR